MLYSLELCGIYFGGVPHPRELGLIQPLTGLYRHAHVPTCFQAYKSYNKRLPITGDCIYLNHDRRNHCVSDRLLAFMKFSTGACFCFRFTFRLAELFTILGGSIPIYDHGVCR